MPHDRSGPLRVALATARQARGLDDDEPLLIAALGERGVEAEPVVWNDADADWSVFDAVVLRSAWDYPAYHDAFTAWTRAVERVTVLRNSSEVVAWDIDKRYLLTLAAHGVPTVPSWVFEPGAAISLPDDVGEVVVKPVISAGSQDTARYRSDERRAALEHIERLLQQSRDALVQPYLSQVDEHGETAIVYLADRFSHAIRKGPILREEPVTVGGLFAREDLAARTPTAVEHDVAEQALDALPCDRRALLYARADLVPSADGTPLVLEVELIEPSLFLRYRDGAAEQFAAAIVAALPDTSDTPDATPMDMPVEEFEQAVGDALDRMPEELARMMSNVAVVVEDDPPPGENLLGLYVGVPLTERDEWWAAGSLPDRITIFRRPILAQCATREQVVEQVEITVVHEIAHHFGIDDDRLHDLGWG